MITFTKHGRQEPYVLPLLISSLLLCCFYFPPRVVDAWSSTLSTSPLRTIMKSASSSSDASKARQGRPFQSTLYQSLSSSSFDYDESDVMIGLEGDDEADGPHEVHWLQSTRASSLSSSQDDDPNYDDLFYDDVLDGSDLDSHSSALQKESLGRSIGQGRAVVCIPNVANAAECNMLFASAVQAATAAGSSNTDGSNRANSMGRSRFSVSDPKAFSNDVVLMCDEILLRVLDHIDTHIPSVYRELFVPLPGTGDDPHVVWLQNQPLNARLEEVTVPPPLDVLQQTTDGLRDLYIQSELEWSEGEPAINVYESGGQFGPHKDHLALTVIIPLTGQEEFDGGGTGFWAGNREVDENQRTSQPDLVLKPSPGSALLFGGDVTHAGMPVSKGLRSVFVCSFSTKTPASSPDRLHGMQAPPQVSPSFSKGSM